MPLVPYKLDPGFNRPPLFPQLVKEQEQPQGGFLKFGENLELLKQDVSKELEIWDAALRLENAPLATFELLTKPAWEPVEDFDLEANLKAADMWDEYKWNFVGVESPGEFLYKTRQIMKERQARELIAASGPRGIVALMAMGALDPTIMLPFLGVGKTLGRGLTVGAAWGLAAGSLQEIPLQLNQELRTMEESGMNVGFSTVLGSVFGGAIGTLRGIKLQTIADRMDPTKSGRAISELEEKVLLERTIGDLERRRPEAGGAKVVTDVDGDIATYKARLRELESNATLGSKLDEIDETLRGSLGRRAGVGADVLDLDAGGLKGMLGVGEKLTTLAGAVTAALGQNVSVTGRRLMAELSTAGVRLERNVILDRNGEIIGSIPSNAGGPVESLIQMRRGETLSLIQKGYENFANYSLTKPGPFRGTRAAIAPWMPGSTKMKPREFFDEVGRAMRSADEHPIPEVAQTAQEFRKYYDDVLKEAQDLGIIPPEVEEITPDLSYLNRVYDTAAISRNPNVFRKLLQDHFEEQLQNDLTKIQGGYESATARDIQRLADMELPLEDAKILRDQFRKELEAIDAAESSDVRPIEEMISTVRAQMAANTRERRALENALVQGDQRSGSRKPIEDQITGLRSVRETMRADVERLQQLGGEDLANRAVQRGELKRRIRNLNRSRFMVEEKHRAKLDKIEALEEMNVDALHRAARAGVRAQNALDKDADAFAKAMTQMSSAVTAAKNTAIKLDAQIDALQAKTGEAVAPDEAAFAKLFQKEAKQQEAVDRFLELEEEFEGFKNIQFAEKGRDEVSGIIQDALDESLRRIEAVNAKRTLRIAKLEGGAGKLDAEAWAAHKKQLETRMKDRRLRAQERVQQLGGEGYDPNFGSVGVSFAERTKEIAESATDKIMGVNVRLAGFDAMADKRGAELARTLSISSEKLSSKGFLVDDAEQLLHVYHNTLIPDIELVRRLGPFAPDGNLNVRFKEVNEERALFQLKTEEALRQKHTKNGVLDKAKFEAENAKVMSGIEKEYKILLQNLDVVVRRLRHQWGVPSSPDGWATRGVQAALSVQGLRFLGTVGVASIPDIGKPIMRYGLGRTLRTAWLPMISNWKAIKMSAQEAQKSFVAVEVLTADRAFQLADLMDFARGKTKVERGLQWATSKMGIIALYAPWTDLMKTGSFMAMTDKVMGSLELALTKGGSSKQRIEAVEFLASLGWNDDMQRQIWDEMMNGGAEKVNGLWVPQTERWTNPEAVRSFRTAAHSEASASIITPGVERPKIADANLPAKLFFNLKSFALSSTSKTVMAALQQRDAAVFNGMMTMLALGALSYYLRSVAAGGETERRMQEATWEQWVDEAVDASGLLGAISIGQRIASGVPGLKNFATVGGVSSMVQGKSTPQTSRSSGAGLVEDVIGPSADLAFTLAQVITGLDNPTRTQIHKVRQLLPFQNLVYIRRLFDQMENAVGDAANLPGQRR